MDKKIRQGIYTIEMRKTALENAKKYDWAKETVTKVTERAEYLLPYVDVLCGLIPSEGFPRASTMSTLNASDVVKCTCPYCGIDIKKEVHNGAWTIDPTQNPWKVSCPRCNSNFPSNDFALLYKRGLNEKGEYDRALALKNNADAVVRGEKDALVNELFPDKDPNWMVDDGFGWSPADGTYGTLDLSKWAPAAYYHENVWFNEHAHDANSFIIIIEVFSQAYLYTGKKEYAQAGIRLLDKVADVYPAYDIKKVSLGYPTPHGMGWNGKIIGSIWENYIAERLIRAYDAFYYLMEEPVRNKVRENIVREAFRAIKSGAIHGNFGLQQKVAALAAATLEDEAEVNEILEWLMQPNGTELLDRGARHDYKDPIYGTIRDVRYKSDGGELVDKYIDEIDHDGFGAEVGITYNKIWFINTLQIAEILKQCGSEKLNLIENPKCIKMFDTFIHQTVAGGTSLAEGDSGYAVSIIYPFANEMLRGYKLLRDPRLAQYYYFYMGGDLSNIYIDMFTDPEELTASLKKNLETYGEYQFESDNLTGYGLTVLREGQHKFDAEKQYDTWMYYGRTVYSHAHRDMLQLGVDAFGVNMAPDLGYPEATAYTPNRYEWVKATISHNTVVVNGESQTEQYTGKSLHYDSTDIVKLVDVDGSVAYEETDIYRRTAVTIAADDRIGYTLDFFRVKGGDSHMYSFHTQSHMGFRSQDVKWVPQTDELGNYIGTYAGPDVPYGHDPNSTDSIRAEKTRYTRGFTWLTHVNKGTVNNGTFSVDFAITDFRKHAKDAKQVHLKYTALNDWIPDSVDMTIGYPPRNKKNAVIPGLDYMFIHRNGKNLDTLYTSLLEPYKGVSYIEKAEGISVSKKEGQEELSDIVKAVKITLKNGACDYVIYATNRDVIYHIEDGAVDFEFRGFVGVYRTDAEGNNTYSYVNDGDILGDTTGIGAYTGSVVDFTKEFVGENTITIQLDQEPDDLQILAKNYVYVDDSASMRNTVYGIKHVTKEGDKYILHLGNTTLVECMADKKDISKGYVYTIKEGQKIRIPVSLIKINE